MNGWMQITAEQKNTKGDALTISEAYTDLKQTNLARIYYTEAITGCEAMSFSQSFVELQKLLKEKTPDTAKINAKVEI